MLINLLFLDVLLLLARLVIYASVDDVIVVNDGNIFAAIRVVVSASAACEFDIYVVADDIDVVFLNDVLVVAYTQLVWLLEVLLLERLFLFLLLVNVMSMLSLTMLLLVLLLTILLLFFIMMLLLDCSIVTGDKVHQ